MSTGTSGERTEASERTRADSRSRAADAANADAAALRPGDAVGGYVVRERVGMGGMGVVYRAWDPRLERDVALKLLRLGRKHRSGASRGRMLREAQALARLSHPNVVPVFEVGWTDRGLFLALEFVEGKNLRQWIDGGPHELGEVLEVFKQAGRGLQAAHEAGLVHRDFKPANVLIGHDGRVRVTDFGLARRTEDSEFDPDGEDALAGGSSDAWPDADPHAYDRLSDSLTRADEVVGTPAYMAPEQGRKGGAGPASDQYSFCIALYEALYGERPFAGVRLRDIRRRGALRLPPAPRDHSVPHRLRRVLARGLDPDPDRRWPSVSALLAALEAHASRRRRLVLAVGVLGALWALLVLARSPIQDAVCGVGTERFAGIWDPDRKQAARSAMLATELPYAERASQRAEGELDAYVQRWSDAYVETCEATHVRGEQSEERLDVRMACLADLRQEVHTVVDLLLDADADMVRNAPQTIAQLTPVSACGHDRLQGSDLLPPDETASSTSFAEVRRKLARARTLGNAGRFDDAKALSREALAQAQASGHATLEARALARLGDVLRNTGEYHEAEANLRDAFFAAQELHMDKIAVYTAAQLVLVVGDKLARFDDGLQWVRHATMALERSGGDDDARAQLEHNTASVLIAAGRYEEAKSHLEEALELRSQNLDSNRFPVAYTLNELGNAYRNQGEFELAEQHYRRSYEIFETSLPSGHPNFGGLLLNLGNVAEAAGKHEQALDRYERALDVWEKTYGEEHPYLAGLLNNIGTSLDSLGRYAEATSYFERARVSWTKRLGPDHPMVGTALTNLGNCAAAQQRWDEAAQYFQNALQILERTLPPDHPDLAHPLVGVGIALLELERAEEAMDSLERVVALHEGRPLAPPNGALGRFGLARALWLQGTDQARALQLAESARDEFEDMGPTGATNLETVRAWLDRRRPTPSSSSD